MKRYSTSVGNHKYLVDLITDTTTIMKKKYVVFRNSDLLNDTILDTDIYFVEKSLLTDTSKILWPNSNAENIPVISTNAFSFSDGLVDEHQIQTGWFELFNRNFQEKEVKVNKLRIWHPTTKVDNSNIIVYANSYVNSVHFHWVCKKLSDVPSYANTEVRENNGIYTEYFDIEIPDLVDVFMHDTWLQEVSKVVKNDEIEGCIKYGYDDGLTIKECEEENANLQISNMIVYTGYWKYTEDTDANGKEYVHIPNSIMQSLNLNVALIPVNGVSESTGIYLTDTDLDIGNVVFGNENTFKLNCTTGFINGEISVIGKFEYDKRLGSLQTAWQKSFNVSFSKYEEMSNQIKKDKETLEELFGGNPNCVKYVCTIATDNKFKSVVYTEERYANTVDDFSIPLHNLIDDWYQVPSHLVVKLSLVDRYVGVTYESNLKVLTKEDIKYIINDEKAVRFDGIINLAADSEEYENIDDMGEFNNLFISRLNCNIIKREGTSNQIRTVSNNPRIIYKPIFFKTQDANTISLRSGLKQNVGVYLNDYMTKVDKFSIKIGSYSIEELARNGVYVIFKVDVSQISDTTGKYDILDDSGEYITSGIYTIE